MTTPTILLIDDDDALIESLSIALEDEGYRVHTARNGHEAFEHLSTDDAPSCILLDLMMPVMNGYQFRSRALEDQRLAQIPTFVLTAGKIDDRLRAMNVAGWFTKPFSIDALMISLEKHLKPEFDVAEAGHVVHLYESERTLVEVVGRYLADGAKQGDGFTVIATPQHTRRFREEMARQGVEPSVLEPASALWLDAATMMARFMEDDRPDPLRFERATAPLLDTIRRASSTGRVRAYGEMVNLLWRDGNLAGALELEQLWNTLAEHHEFSLLCAYDLQGRDARERSALAPLCDEHSIVLGRACRSKIAAYGRT